MDNGNPQFALREWRAHIAQPATLVALSGIAAVLAIAGPFGTATYLTLLPRAAYWLCICFATYSVGFLASTWTRAWLTGKAPRGGIILVAGLLTGCGAAIVVIVANAITFGIWPTGPDALMFLAAVFPISLIITAVLDYLATATPSATGDAAPAPAPPAVLERLPLDKRGALLSLSSEDHYTRIRTAKGDELVLMRLADAIGEAAPTRGLQVHRSHWVSIEAVTAARRDGDRAILTLSDGAEIPVSRANVPTIREAGLLPR